MTVAAPPRAPSSSIELPRSTRTRRKQISRLVTFSNLVPVVKLYKLACQQQAAQFEAASKKNLESSILQRLPKPPHPDLTLHRAGQA